MPHTQPGIVTQDIYCLWVHIKTVRFKTKSWLRCFVALHVDGRSVAVKSLTNFIEVDDESVNQPNFKRIVAVGLKVRVLARKVAVGAAGSYTLQ
jgi:hypothetical protein